GGYAKLAHRCPRTRGVEQLGHTGDAKYQGEQKTRYQQHELHKSRHSFNPGQTDIIDPRVPADQAVELQTLWPNYLDGEESSVVRHPNNLLDSLPVSCAGDQFRSEVHARGFLGVDNAKANSPIRR